MKTQLNDVETFCVNFSDISDQMTLNNRRIFSEISDLKAKNTFLENEISDLRKSNSDLKAMCLRMQTRSMENNLLLFGLDEALPSDDQREIPEKVVRTFLKNYIQDNCVVNTECPVYTDSMKFEKVHRIGNPVTARRNGRPRPMVVTFASFTDREKVRLAGTILNKSQTEFKIYEHFPREVEEKRKILYPIARRHGEKGAKVSLIRDQLFVNDQLYDIETASFIERNRVQAPDTRATRSGGTGRYPPRWRPRSPRHESQERGRSPSVAKRPEGADRNPPRWRPRSPGHDSQERGRPTSVVSQQRYTQQAVRRAPINKGIPNYAKRVETNFETPNRFETLSQEQTKRKAVSPLDADYSAKRLDVLESNIDSSQGSVIDCASQNTVQHMNVDSVIDNSDIVCSEAVTVDGPSTTSK
jgi:hypothetical protein